MSTKARLKRLEAQVRADDGRPEITISVTPPGITNRERDPDGLPILTTDERTAVAAGDTLCFMFDDPPYNIAFKPDGRGGITIRTH